jgi:WD40 repeat protein
MSFVLNDGALATGVMEEAINSQKPASGLSPIEEDVVLPNEIIAHIASYTRIREGYSMEVVNKAWNKTLQENEIWHRYNKRIPGYLRAKEEYQAEHTQAHDKHILKKLLKPKVYKFPHNHAIGHIDAMSDDGRTMVGSAAGRKLFVFTEQDGIDYDFTLNPGEVSIARGMSTDGKAIVGFVKNNLNGNKNAFIKIKNTHKTILAPLNGGQPNYAVGVSDDCKTVAGIALDGLNQRRKAVVWKVDSGALLTLDNFIGANKGSQAKAISKNGRFVAGTLINRETIEQDGFVWDLENNQMTYLDTQNGDVSAISANGEKVAGVARNLQSNRDEAFIYDTLNHQIQFLGTINNGHYSEVTGLSTDGKVAVGYSVDGSKEQKEDTEEFHPEEPSPETHASFIYYGNGIGMQPVKRLLQGQLLEEEDPFAHLRVSGNGTIIMQADLLGWYAYIPRYDVLQEEGLKLLPQTDEQNNQG